MEFDIIRYVLIFLTYFGHKLGTIFRVKRASNSQSTVGKMSEGRSI
jgi:hypothetical protein